MSIWTVYTVTNPFSTLRVIRSYTNVVAHVSSRPHLLSLKSAWFCVWLVALCECLCVVLSVCLCLPINPSRIIYVCWLLLLLLLLSLCFAACQPVGLGIHLWAVPISSACTAIVRGDHMLGERFECNDICLMTKSDKSNLCWQIKVWRVSFTTQNKYKTQPRKLEKERKEGCLVEWCAVKVTWSEIWKVKKIKIKN